ncbi:hypothetical protein Scep_001811 [Stephania cephalantha]|uniref:Uncharacterized protein n=1 Tax=Stephania cephalantha TaxID=152367 RepID=A0AAP0LBI2_9MAGN
MNERDLDWNDYWHSRTNLRSPYPDLQNKLGQREDRIREWGGKHDDKGTMNGRVDS